VLKDFAGLTGFALAFIFPALLARKSRKRFMEEGIDVETAYSVSWLSRSSHYITIVLGLVLVVWVGGSLITIGAATGDRR
jgi:hypothetical protein